MRIPPHTLRTRIARLGALGALASALLVGGPALVSSASAVPGQAEARAHAARLAQPAASVGHICSSSLPPEAHDTLDLIEAGGPYPYPQDGTVFTNREGVLPDQASGYYHEYTVKTPGSPDRGARRIVTGEAEQEDYYTADHYASFDRVDFGC